MPVIFNPRPGAANLLAMEAVSKLDMSQPMPEAPISAGHALMAFAYALGALGIHIGVGQGEVPPDDALRAWSDGLSQTRGYAAKRLA